jgi:hypothetical protein
MMNTAIAFNEHSPCARIGFKRTKLVQVKRVPNLTCHWMSVRHCLPPTRRFWHQCPTSGLVRSYVSEKKWVNGYSWG